MMNKIALIVVQLILFTAAAAAQQQSPVAWWKFNEGSGNLVADSVSGTKDVIQNHFRWARGASEGGLKFDGFTTFIERPAKNVPKLETQFSIEAWVAIQSYPWNWVAIVDQEKNRQSGYYFGIDAEGRLGLQLSVQGTWQTCVSQTRIPLMQWTHVVGTFDPASGVLLYMNGKLAGQLSVKGRSDPANDVGLRIGRNLQNLPPIALVRTAAAIPTYYSLDGVLNTLKIYNRTLTPEEVAVTAGERPSVAPDLTPRHWPVISAQNRFGAAYTALSLYPEWDALWRTDSYSDIVVSFADKPYHYVFWRGGNFGNTMITENGIWIGDQSFESGTDVGTAEHMNDKHNSHSHISIVENSDARIVLHWRYGLVDVTDQFSNVDPTTGWGDWADELFYIYPDGVAIRVGTVHGTAEHYSFTEPTILLEPGKKPEDYISLRAATVANSRAEQHTYSWDPVSPPSPFPDSPSNANIAVLNLKSEYKPFYVFQPGTALGPYGWPPELRPEYSHFPVWDHWPVNQAPTDGRYQLFPDDFASAAVMSPEPAGWITGPGPTQTNYFLFGLTKEPIADLAMLDRFWLNPPAIQVSSGDYSAKFEPSQKAFVVERNTPAQSQARVKLEMTITASDQSPAVNPAFVVKNWGDLPAIVKLDGKPLSAKMARTGFIHRLEGTDLVVWVQTQSSHSFHLTISQ